MLVCSARVFNETDCGVYRAGAAEWRLVVSGPNQPEAVAARGDLGSRAPYHTPESIGFEQCYQADTIELRIDRAYGDFGGVGELMVFGAPLP